MIQRLTRALYAGEESGDAPEAGEGRVRWALRPRAAIILVCAVALGVVGFHIYAYVWAAHSLDEAGKGTLLAENERGVGAASGYEWGSASRDPSGGVGRASGEESAQRSADAEGEGSDSSRTRGGEVAGASGKKRDASHPSPALSPKNITVYVTGKVGKPGIVRLPEGARVHEALDAAGGALGEADLTALNLARVLADGEQIWLGGVGEKPPPGLGSGSSGGNGHGKRCVDVASADERELQELDGVGPALAARIARFRESHGGVSSVDDLMGVPGIGQNLLEKIRAGAC